MQKLIFILFSFFSLITYGACEFQSPAYKAAIATYMNSLPQRSFNVRPENIWGGHGSCSQKVCLYGFSGSDISSNGTKNYKKLFQGLIQCDLAKGTYEVKSGYFADVNTKHGLELKIKRTACYGQESEVMKKFVAEAKQNLQGFDPTANITFNNVYSVINNFEQGVFVAELWITGFAHLRYQNGSIYSIFGGARCNPATGKYEDNHAGHQAMAWNTGPLLQ